MMSSFKIRQAFSVWYFPLQSVIMLSLPGIFWQSEYIVFFKAFFSPALSFSFCSLLPIQNMDARAGSSSSIFIMLVILSTIAKISSILEFKDFFKETWPPHAEVWFLELTQLHLPFKALIFPILSWQQSFLMAKLSILDLLKHVFFLYLSVIQNDCVIALLLLFFSHYYCFYDVPSNFCKDFLFMSTLLVKMMTNTH